MSHESLIRSARARFKSVKSERIANECTVSGDSFIRPGCGAVQYRER
jgi:hypothetical protein